MTQHITLGQKFSSCPAGLFPAQAPKEQIALPFTGITGTSFCPSTAKTMIPNIAFPNPSPGTAEPLQLKNLTFKKSIEKISLKNQYFDTFINSQKFYNWKC